MVEEKVYIKSIDGTDVWIPISAKLIGGNRFEILDDNEYDNRDNSILYEFYPGDIIESAEYNFEAGKSLIAKQIIEKGKSPDRKFYEFQFQSVIGKIKIDKQTAEYYQDEIK